MTEVYEIEDELENETELVPGSTAPFMSATSLSTIFLKAHDIVDKLVAEMKGAVMQLILASIIWAALGWIWVEKLCPASRGTC